MLGEFAVISLEPFFIAIGLVVPGLFLIVGTARTVEAAIKKMKSQYPTAEWHEKEYRYTGDKK